MAAATSLAIASLATTAIGTGLSVYGQMQAAEAQEAAAAANAQAMEQAAKAREAEAHEDILRQAREARRALAQMRATMADGGAEINDGSNRDVLGVASTRLETRILDASRQATLEAAAMRHRAALGTWQAEQGATATRLSAFGSVLTGASTGTRDAYTFKKQGAI